MADDIAFLLATRLIELCRAYEEAAGPVWPSAELSAALAKAAGVAGSEVKAKIRPLR